jgi:hypothetical protein
VQCAKALRQRTLVAPKQIAGGRIERYDLAVRRRDEHLEDDFENCELKARWLFWRRGRADRLPRFEPPLPRRTWWKSYSTYSLSI